MSRLEKARAQKQKGKKKALILAAVMVLVILAAGLFYIFQDNSLEFLNSEAPDFIDRERTEAFVDIFGLTYVRVYLLEGFAASEVTVNGEEMRQNTEQGRWEIVLRDYEQGDQLEVIVVTDQGRSQELSVIVREM